MPRSVRLFRRCGRRFVGRRIAVLDARLRHPEPYQQHGERAGAREPEEADRIAEMIGDVAGRRGAERRADPGREPEQADAEVVAPLPPATSAAISGSITPNTAALMPSSICTGTSR